MGLLRNKEIKRTLVIYTLLGTFFGVISFLVDIYGGIITVAAWAVFMLVYFIQMKERYRRISELSCEIDKILHKDGFNSLEKFSEGELGVLQSEIYKMTVRLREQSQNLKDEKIYLADSLADISHQIKTPLTTVNLLVSLLSEPELSDERRGELCLELFEMLSRIDELITVLLKISRLDAKTVKLTLENISLKEIAEKAVEPLLVPIDIREQRLIISCNGNICCDTMWLSEAITNIVKNCTEHTPKGGVIEITGEENAIYSQLVIKDNGTGFDFGEQYKIFERFYKGKGSDNKSFGIGLSLARMIITEHNGTVKADNAPEGGARFTVRIYKSVV